MEMEFDVRITKKDLYDYQLHHAYTSPSGLFGTIVGCLFIVGFLNTGTALYLIIGAFVIPSTVFLVAQYPQHTGIAPLVATQGEGSRFPQLPGNGMGALSLLDKLLKNPPD